MKQILLLILSGMLFSWAAQAQGGKAEPNRIEFAIGRTSVTLAGTLSNAEEMEYVFRAGKGQKVTLKMATPNLFDYRVFNPDADFETEFDSSTTSSFELPADGDYFLFIRKKMVKQPRKAKYRLVVAIK